MSSSYNAHDNCVCVCTKRTRDTHFYPFIIIPSPIHVVPIHAAWTEMFVLHFTRRKSKYFLLVISHQQPSYFFPPRV